METVGQQEKMQRFLQLSEKIGGKDICLEIIKELKILEIDLFTGKQVATTISEIRINNNKEIAYWANRNIDITEFVRDCNFIEKGSTQRWPRYEKGEEVLLITENNTVVKAKNGQSQNLFEFIKERYPKSNPNISDTSHFISEILKREGLRLTQVSAKREDQGQATIDQESKAIKKIFDIKDYRLDPLDLEKNYLISRGITIETLQDPLFKGTIFSGNKVKMEKWQNNIIYPFRQHPQQQEVSTLMMQYGKKIDIEGKLVDKIFAPGDGKAQSLWMSNKPEQIRHIRVMENPLDCLSHYQAYKPKDSLYVATGGRPAGQQLELVDKLAKEYGAQPVISFDRDMAGYRFDAMYMERRTKSFHVTGTDDKTNIVFDNLEPGTKDYLMAGLDVINTRYTNQEGRVAVLCECIDGIDFCIKFANTTGINNGNPVIYEKSVMKDFNDDLNAEIRTQYKSLEYPKTIIF